MANNQLCKRMRIQSVLVSILLALSYCAATAQDISPETAKSRLAAAKVHLSQGSTTFGKALAALATQANLAITAAPALTDHKLVVNLEDISAEHALDAICELNDWIWTIDTKGHVVVDRPKILQPHNLIELHNALWNALPVAYRNFVSMAPNSTSAQIDKLYDDPTTNSIQLGQGTRNDELKLFFHAKAFTVKSRTDFIVTGLMPRLTNGKRLEYALLTPDQKQALLEGIVVAAMGNLESLGFVWSPRFKPFELDLLQTKIKIVNGNEIQFDNQYVDEAGRHGEGIGGGITTDK